MHHPLVVRLPLTFAVLLLGAATGLAGVVLHLYLWGLVLTVAATVITAYALPPGSATRVPFGLGFAGIVVLGTTARPEGDYLVAQTLNGYVLLAVAVAVFVSGFLTSMPRRRAPIVTPPSDPAAPAAPGAPEVAS